MENAERMCDSVCIIARGEKVLDGAVSEVKAEHGQRNVALGLVERAVGMDDLHAAVLGDRTLVAKVDDNNRALELELAPAADPQVLLHRLLAAGAQIERFELVHPSLHQIFLQRVGAAGADITGVERGMSGHG
jgi:ABC-2 type transport system ATP-binding protein